MPDGDAKTSPTADTKFGRGFLHDIWYFAALSGDLKAGKLQRYEILGEPILLGRDRAGKVYALKDICPHRAAPLSAGKLTREADGAESVECPYHGWRFKTDGACAAIPSLVDDEAMDVSRIRVRNYPAAESQGLVFVWISGDPRFTGEPSEPPPVFPGVVGGGPKLVDRMDFDAHIDHAVVGLMDPAHGPYVHQQWWWRSTKSQHEKAKKFEPREQGFAMVRHEPSKNSRAYAILGGEPLTEITFRIPGLRWEHVTVGQRGAVADLPDADQRGQDPDHPDRLVRSPGVPGAQAVHRRRRAGLPAPGRRHGEPAERGPALRSLAAVDRRRRPSGQVVPAAEARMDREPEGGAAVREPGRGRHPALAQLTGTCHRRAPRVC